MKPLRSLAAVFAVAVLLAIPSSSALASPKALDQTIKGAEYLVTRQVDDGGFFIRDSPPNMVSEVISALALAGGPESSVDKALTYIAQHGPKDAARRGAFAGRIVSGLVAAGRDPGNFGGFDYVSQLESFHNPVTGQYDTGDLSQNDSGDVYDNALAALGIVGAGKALPDSSVDYFALNQCEDGGFASPNGCLDRSDIDTTALVVRVISAVDDPRSSRILESARSFLTAAQNDSGGFGFYPNDSTASNSTGLAIAAIVSLDEDPRAWRKGNADPISALVSLQQRDGSFRHKATIEGAKDWATVQAVQGLGTVLGDRSPAKSDESGLSPIPDNVASGSTAQLPEGSAPNEAISFTEIKGSAPLAESSSGSFARKHDPRGPSQTLGILALGLLVLSAGILLRRVRTLFLVLFPLGAFLVPPWPLASDIACASEKTAMVVVRGPDGNQMTRCLEPLPDTSGIEALRKAGFEIETKQFMGLGEAVCSIDGKGSKASSCLGGDGHWHYWTYSGGAWTEAEMGASQSTLSAGESDGWTWSQGTNNAPPEGAPVCTEDLVPTSSPRQLSKAAGITAILMLSALMITFRSRRRRLT